MFMVFLGVEVLQVRPHQVSGEVEVEERVQRDDKEGPGGHQRGHGGRRRGRQERGGGQRGRR